MIVFKVKNRAKFVVIFKKVIIMQKWIRTWHAGLHGWRPGSTSSSWCSAGPPRRSPAPQSGRSPSTPSSFWTSYAPWIFFLQQVLLRPDGVGKVGLHILVPEEEKATSTARVKSFLHVGQVGTLKRRKVFEMNYWVFMQLNFTCTRRLAMKSFRKSGNWSWGWALL